MTTNQIRRRSVFKGVGGIAAASLLGTGAVALGAAPAHASPIRVLSRTVDGRMHTYHISSPSLKKKPRVNVLLPSDYGSGKRYPVLYLFHGGNGSYSDFDKHNNIRQITEGKPLIVVMPDSGVSWHSNPARNGLTNRQKNWETFQIKELLPWVDSSFRTHATGAGRAVSGFSMGGFGALKFGAKYPHLFASVSAHSGPANLRRDGHIVTRWANITSRLELGLGGLYGLPWNQARITADNPMENLESYRGKRVFLVAGTEIATLDDGAQFDDDSFGRVNERYVLRGQRDFGTALTKAGIRHERYEDPGAHFVRPERLRQDVDGVIAHLTKAS